MSVELLALGLLASAGFMAGRVGVRYFTEKRNADATPSEYALYQSSFFVPLTGKLKRYYIYDRTQKKYLCNDHDWYDSAVDYKGYETWQEAVQSLRAKYGDVEVHNLG